MAGRIFVNYRREDERAMAARVRDRLAQTFGAARVFMDVDNLRAGQRFDQELERALTQTDVFISVIGSRWMELLTKRQASGERDYVREEIAAALTRRITVIPVMIERAPLPRTEALPEDIRELFLHQKHDVSHESFGRDVGALIEAIRIARKRAETRRPLVRTTMLAGGSLLVLAGGAFVLWFVTFQGDPSSSAAGRAKVEQDDRAKAEQAARARADEMERLRLAAVKAEDDRRTMETEAAALRAQAETRRRVEEAERERLAALQREKENDLKAEQARQAVDAARKAAEEVEVTTREFIIEAQEKLYELNYDPGPADGAMTRATELAVREFQARSGLVSTGRLTHGLLQRLRAAETLKPWGAIVYSPSAEKWGMSWNKDRRRAAISAAQSSCSGTAAQCPTVLTFFGSQCAAFAYSGTSFALVGRDSSSFARAAALEQCQKSGARCKIVASVCADGRERLGAE